MNPGKKKRKITVEPIKNPVPQREPAPERPEPKREPDPRPAPEPERVGTES